MMDIFFCLFFLFFASSDNLWAIINWLKMTQRHTPVPLHLQQALYLLQLQLIKGLRRKYVSGEAIINCWQ